MGRIGGFGIILAVLCFLPLFGSATGQDSVQIFTNGSIYIDAEKKVDNLQSRVSQLETTLSDKKEKSSGGEEH